MTTRRRRRAEKEGIRWRRGKWQAYVKVDGTQYPKTFPALTPVAEMQQWRRDEIIRRTGATVAPVDGSFADDVQTYLRLIVPRDAAPHLELWLQALGRDRPRRSITEEDITRVLNQWRTEPPPAPPRDGKPHGRPPVDPRGFLSLETIRKRKTSLQSFFERMNKGHGRNPAKEAVLPQRLPEGEARSLDFLVIERALAAMPTYQHGAVSLAKIRARVIAYTALPPKMLQQVKAHDLSIVAGTLRVMARHKGAGVGESTIHLNEEALAAFRDFHAANAYGRFRVQTVNQSFKRGARRAGLDPRAVHLYDLRHSYLTEVYRITRDHATVARLGLHAPGSRITARYTRGANAEVDAAAVEAFSERLARRRREALKPAPKGLKKGLRVSAKGVRIYNA
jgi:hypothetical protein